MGPLVGSHEVAYGSVPSFSLETLPPWETTPAFPSPFAKKKNTTTTTTTTKKEIDLPREKERTSDAAALPVGGPPPAFVWPIPKSEGEKQQRRITTNTNGTLSRWEWMVGAVEVVEGEGEDEDTAHKKETKERNSVTRRTCSPLPPTPDREGVPCTSSSSSSSRCFPTLRFTFPHATSSSSSSSALPLLWQEEEEAPSDVSSSFSSPSSGVDAFLNDNVHAYLRLSGTSFHTDAEDASASSSCFSHVRLDTNPFQRLVLVLPLHLCGPLGRVHSRVSRVWKAVEEEVLWQWRLPSFFFFATPIQANRANGEGEADEVWPPCAAARSWNDHDVLHAYVRYQKRQKEKPSPPKGNAFLRQDRTPKPTSVIALGTMVECHGKGGVTLFTSAQRAALRAFFGLSSSSSSSSSFPLEGAPVWEVVLAERWRWKSQWHTLSPPSSKSLSDGFPMLFCSSAASPDDVTQAMEVGVDGCRVISHRCGMAHHRTEGATNAPTRQKKTKKELDECVLLQWHPGDDAAAPAFFLGK